MSFVLRKLRLIWPQISTTDIVLNVKTQKIEDLEYCVALCLRQFQQKIIRVLQPLQTATHAY